MSIRAATLMTLVIAAVAAAAVTSGPPLAGVWNIAVSGTAGSSGTLAFRFTRADGSNPADITVPVIAGASQDTVVNGIRRALGSQLRSDRYHVQLGENANVLVSDPQGKPTFSIELVDSGIEDVRVAVQSVTPAASPTVPEQSAPPEIAGETPPASNETPGNATPPPESGMPAPAPETPPVTAPPPAPGPPPDQLTAFNGMRR